jgi:hypothetical protein
MQTRGRVGGSSGCGQPKGRRGTGVPLRGKASACNAVKPSGQGESFDAVPSAS